MRPLTSETGFRRNYPDCRYVSTWLIVTICALVVPGCEEETRSVAKRPETRALDQTGIAVGLDETAGATPVQTKPAGKTVWANHRPTHHRHSQRKQGAESRRCTGRIAKNRLQRSDHASGKCVRFDCRPVICPLDPALDGPLPRHE